MAMIKCQECKKKISSLAVTCPNCGAPLEKKPPVEKKASASPEGKKKSTPWLVIFIVTGLIIWFVVQVNKTPEQKVRDQKARAEKAAGQNAKTKAWETAVLTCKGKPWSFVMSRALEAQGYGKAETLPGNNRWYMEYYPKGDFTIAIDKSKNDIVRHVFHGKHTDLPAW